MQHLDEGTIHAWLDGALTADEAARVDQHASECAECGAMVAEARGLVAGASRILSSLDDVPAVTGAGSGGGMAATTVASIQARRRERGRRFWSRPAVIAAAASVVLVAGTALIMREGRFDMTSAAVEMPTDSAVVLGHRTTEAGAAASSEAVATAGRDAAAGNFSRDGRGATAGTSGTAGTAPRGAVTVQPANAPAVPAADRQAAQRRENEAPVARPMPSPAATLGDVARKAAAPAMTLEQRSDDAAAAADTARGARTAVAQRAAPARARSERSTAMTGAAASGRTTRVDTIYRPRPDTIAARVDTVIVEPPAPPGLRGAGRAGNVTRAFPVTGCYEVVEGQLPRSITLTASPVWSGAAEQRFVATAPGATGYWSQPTSGDVHLVIARALVTARIDASTGELRGKAQRAGKSETFVARRGCR